MMQRRAVPSIRIGAAVAIAVVLLAGAKSVAAEATKPASSCVACHTNPEQLKAEAAKVPTPAGSALQAGKG